MECEECGGSDFFGSMCVMCGMQRSNIETGYVGSRTLQSSGCGGCGTDSSSFRTKDGYIICGECGMVQDTHVSEEPEWGNYRGDDGSITDRARAYTSKDALNPFSGDHGTRMSTGLRVSYVSKKDGKKKSFDLSKLHDQMNYTNKQRSYDLVRNYLENILTSKFFHQSIIHTAQVLWGEIAQNGKIYRDGVRRGLIVCCVYYSCLHHKSMYSPLEICKLFNMEDTKDFLKGDKVFTDIFADNKNWNSLLGKTSNSDCFFGQFCTKLGMEWYLQRKCSVLFNFHRKKLSQVIPKSAAAGCIYYVLANEASEKVSRTSISKELGVCVPTLQKVYKILEQEELKRINSGVIIDMPKKIVSINDKYSHNIGEIVPIGKTKNNKLVVKQKS